jgi:hypothetical protein
MMFGRLSLAVLFVCSCTAISAGEDRRVDFEHEVLPILESHCYDCHDGRKQTSGFRLDVKSRAIKGGDSGDAAIVAGKSDASQIVARIASNDPDVAMPPRDKAKPLAESEVATIRSWIDQGANWPDKLANEDRLKKDHWAFKAPVRPELPTVSDAKWAQNPIDQFILAKLDAETTRPSATADRVTLLRRVSLDLVGLPPTIEETDAFLKDESPQAYEHVVDRLLASPHFGECWGRHWLDGARYADSDGFEKDKPRYVWFYRDWVVDAMNRDLPYDQFVVDQIAGDQKPNATQADRVATGFLRNSMINEEGGIDPEQFRMEAMFDRMDAIGKSVLGITIQCAQCHNHKFDPLTQEEYYQMFAFLNDSHEANIAVYSPDDEMRRADVMRGVSENESELKRDNPDWRERMAKWEETVAHNQPQWTVVKPDVDENSAAGQKFIPQDDGSLSSLGYAASKTRIKLKVQTDTTPINAFRLELLTDPCFPLGGPGRSIYGTAALTEFEVETASADAPTKTKKIKLATATADINPPEAELPPIYNDKSNKKRTIGPASFAIDGKPETAWATDTDPGRRNQPRKIVFTTKEPLTVGADTILYIYLDQNHGGWNSDDNQNHNFGKFRISVTSATNAVADPLPANVREIFEIEPENRTQRQVDAVFSYFRTTVPEWQKTNDRIDKLWKTYPEGASQLVLEVRDQSRETHILQRGDFLKPDRKVEPGVPAFLNTLADDAPRNRLTFAKWMVDRKSPTTARALVNRIWQTYFGAGLVNSSEDLGTRCELPSHPALLDWLAVELMDNNWSLKHLHRLIVTSAAYQQSSHVRSELLEKDPYNRLVAYGPRFRPSAEVVRDIALSASGLINLKVGGPCIFPAMPEFLLNRPVSYAEKNWPVSKGEEKYRRALYIFRFRTAMYPQLQTFDTPTFETSCVRRARSNTPLQALVGLNEPTTMECARNLAKLTLEKGGETDDSRITYAFRRCVSREPTADERAELLQFCDKQKKRLAEGWLNAWQLLGENAPSKSDEKDAKRAAEASANIPAGCTPTEFAAWTCVARTILNLDETITKE